MTPTRHGDARGFFGESWNRQRTEDARMELNFVQDNHSLSAKTGTLRGLHFQAPPHAQAKLVRCGKGALYDVAVDIRFVCPTYGKWVRVDLSVENGRQLPDTAGFLHGFVTRTPNTEIIYKCSNYYSPKCDGAVHWESYGINWGVNANDVLISEKDAKAPALADFDSPFVGEGRK